MPLLDHFHPPLAPRRHWESFHVNWAGSIADVLNESLLPEGYFAEEHARLGPPVEIDVVEIDVDAFPEAIEILVFESEREARLVAAIELVSLGNKERCTQRQGFVAKCARCLRRGISLIVIDIVTIRRANLHNELMRVLDHGDDLAMPAEPVLYAVAYRPTIRDEQPRIEVWTSPLEVGGPLPVLPLWLNAELVLPIDLEATYTTACRRRRLA
jgi:hypothetical protein